MMCFAFGARFFRGVALVGALLAVGVGGVRAGGSEFEVFENPYKTGPISDSDTYFGSSATSGAWTWTGTGNTSLLWATADGPNSLWLTSLATTLGETNTIDFTTTILPGTAAFTFHYDVSGHGIGSAQWMKNGSSVAVLEGAGWFSDDFVAGDVVGFRVTTEYTSLYGDAEAKAVISSFDVTMAAIPEPATYAAWLAGAAGLVALRRRRKRAGR